MKNSEKEKQLANEEMLQKIYKKESRKDKINPKIIEEDEGYKLRKGRRQGMESGDKRKYKDN